MAAIWLLFFSSVGTLLFNSFMAFLLPSQEQAARERLRVVCQHLVSLAEPEVDRIPAGVPTVPGEFSERLKNLSASVLRAAPGVEGGFYINHNLDEFAGYAFPTDPNRDDVRNPRQGDPPPREELFIRLQARQSAAQDEPEVLLQSRHVGPNRVVVATAPVGPVRPAPMVVWLMYRMTGPEQQRAKVLRYQVSTFLALGGITLALVLTLNLRQTLRQERESRERLRDELRRSEHLASLGLLLAQVAHEVRNPLAGIRSTVQLWQRLPAETRTPESLAAVIAAVDRLDTLLSQLLYFSRAENTGRERVDLNALVRETTELLQAQAASQNVQIDVESDPRSPAVHGSAPALRQVVLNLANNALQAMPGSGRLTFRTRLRESERLVELQVADTGRGIDAAIRARLFEPFFTTRPQGTGLGLALCREIVIQHHGQIAMLDAQPQGTICRILLPEFDSDSDTPAHPAAPATASRKEDLPR